MSGYENTHSDNCSVRKFFVRSAIGGFLYLEFASSDKSLDVSALIVILGCQ